MKKFSIALALICSTISLGALDYNSSSWDFGIGYMNYAIITEYNRDSFADQLEGELEGAIGPGSLKMANPKSKDYYNALTLGVGGNTNYLYGNLSVAFPFRKIELGSDPISNKITELNATSRIGGSVIVDAQVGGSVSFGEKKPFNIFFGGAVAINYIKTKREMPRGFVALVPSATRLTEIRSISMLGLGVDIAGKYYFTKNLGVCLNIKDSVYFIPMVNQLYYEGIAKNGNIFQYYVTEEQTASIKSLVTHQWANNFALRFGLAVKF